jgi:transcription antitermination factor NusG
MGFLHAAGKGRQKKTTFPFDQSVFSDNILIMTIALSQNPEPIFPKDLLSPSYLGITWYVVHVKSRREKVLADFLLRRSIGYCLPLVKKRQASNRRVRYSMVPIFPGYLFINTNETGRLDVFKSNHASRVIKVVDPDTLVRELNQVNHLLSADNPVYPVDFLNVGQSVRVKSGYMKGIEGIIIRKDKKYRLAISVTSIMQSISVEIDADMVEPL